MKPLKGIEHSMGVAAAAAAAVVVVKGAFWLREKIK